MSNMLMSITREEALEAAIDCAKRAQIDMQNLADGNVEEDDVMNATSVVRGWVDVADTWISISRELPGLPRPNPENKLLQLAHLFPDGPVQVRTEAA